MDSRIKRTATAIAVATVLAMPGVALAQTDAEKALEARVAELEKLVQQMSTQQAAPAATAAPATTPAAPPPAPTVSTANKGSLTVKGFVIASLYAQDANFAFGNGQSAEFPTGEYDTDKITYGGDVRNTRLTLDWKGPEVANGAKFGGLVEMDFFGGFTGGAFTDEQPNPRLRLAYVDVTKGDTTIRIGQAWSPFFGNVPVSPTHVAFPLGYGSAGMVGWRFPGLFVYHNFSKNTKLTLAAMRGSWNDASPTFGNGAGESGTPQFEARLDFTAGPLNLYVVGHYDQKDCTLVGDTARARAHAATATPRTPLTVRQSKSVPRQPSVSSAWPATSTRARRSASSSGRSPSSPISPAGAAGCRAASSSRRSGRPTCSTAWKSRIATTCSRRSRRRPALPPLTARGARTR